MPQNMENGKVTVGNLGVGGVYWRWVFIGGITVVNFQKDLRLPIQLPNSSFGKLLLQKNKQTKNTVAIVNFIRSVSVW